MPEWPHLAHYLGQHVTVTTQRRGGPEHQVVGTIDRAERVLGVTISTEEGDFLACRFRIKPDDGSRAVWTVAFADRDFPLPNASRPEDGGS